MIKLTPAHRSPPCITARQLLRTGRNSLTSRSRLTIIYYTILDMTGLTLSRNTRTRLPSSRKTTRRLSRVSWKYYSIIHTIPYKLAHNAVVAAHPEKALLLQYDTLVSGKAITGRILFYVAMVRYWYWYGIVLAWFIFSLMRSSIC